MTQLSDIRSPIVYERLWDARPKRTIDEHIQIIKELNTDFIFRANWRWTPMYPNCSVVPAAQYQTCIDSGYTFDQQSQIISRIKQEKPNIIIIGAIPAQKMNINELNEITGETFNKTQTYAMALDPGKWGINSPTKDELQRQMASTVSTGNYYPDITNLQFQELLLSWVKRQIDSGMDGIWIDLLYTQADMLKGFTDLNHPAVKDSFMAASDVIDKIHDYGNSKGKYIHVGTWDQPGGYMGRNFNRIPSLDFITATPSVQEVQDKSLNEAFWDDKITKAALAFGDIPLFTFIDWAGKSAQTGTFSKLSIDDQNYFLTTSKEFFDGKGIKFIYPVHGGVAAVLAFNKDYWYDSLAPEFQTYDTIRTLMTGGTPSLTECYRGYIIYYPPPPAESGYEQYATAYTVLFNNPIPNITGDKPYWIARYTLEELKLAIDNVILTETPYKQNPEGDQCEDGIVPPPPPPKVVPPPPSNKGLILIGGGIGLALALWLLLRKKKGSKGR